MEFLAPKPGPQRGPLTGDLATAGIKKAAQKTVPETKPEVVRVAGQSGALQLPKGAIAARLG